MSKYMDMLRPPTIESQVASLTDAIGEQRPVFAGILKENGKLPLHEYVSRFKTDEVEPIQPRDDFIEVAVAQAESVLGKSTAEKLRGRLEASQSIVTGHHMGVDYFPLTWQTTLVTSLGESADSVIPVFAGGVVPGGNATYPLGISLTREEIKNAGKDKEGKVITKSAPVRFGIFPSRKYTDAVVAAMPAFDVTMVKKTLDTMYGARGRGIISHQERLAIEHVLKTIYMDPEVLAQKNYTDQATLANHRLFPLLFSPEIREDVPELVYLQLETITDTLLGKDLANENSLAYQVLFNPEIREGLIEKLDGVPGCWDLEKPFKGTEFFWGINEKMEKISLTLTDNDGELVLVGKDIVVPFTPTGLQEGLQKGKIHPNLFLTFTELAFARGLKCYGGFMQTDYLTKMKTGLRTSLDAAGYDNWSSAIADVSTENYVTGITPVLGAYDNGIIKPIGAIEVIGNGGLTKADMQALKTATLEGANVMSLPQIYSIVHIGQQADASLERVTPQAIYEGLKPPVVTLDLSLR